VYPTNPIIWLILEILNIYTIVIIVAVVVSWLVAFNVINLYNAFIRSVVRILDALTEPVFALVRKVIPSIAGLDLSPLIVLLAVYFLQYSVGWFAFRMGI
jgi:YggT family protein